MFKKSVFFILIGLIALNLPAMNAPDLRCIAVAANGDVTLSWQTPAIPGGETFNSYQVFTSTIQAGPYTQAATISNYSQTSYTHIGANANTGPVFYYIKTCYDPGTNFSVPSDTLKSIFLTVTNLADGTATLSWNAMHIPNLTSSSGVYKIYREYPAGTWTFIGNTTNLNYKDTISICSVFLNYRVEIADQSGCVSVSSIDGDFFTDIISPNTPVPISVTVDPATGIASISWNASTSADTKGYVIYKLNSSGSWIPIDTVYGINNTSFSDPSSNAGSQSEFYRLAALDSCTNISIQGPVHRTIYATVSLDRCTASNKITWNKYIHMPGGVGGYKIFVSVNGGAFSLLATNTANDSDYTHTGLTDLDNYCYYIEAYNVPATITSTSNKCCNTANLPKQPAFSYLRKASVSGKKSITITCYVDTNAGVSHYDFKRSNTSSGTYVVVGTVPFSASSTITFVDTSPDTDVQSYYYRMSTVDSCGNEMILTNIGRTVLLTVTGNSDLSNTLAWNDYESWLGSVSSYNIFRSTDGNFNSPPIANIPYSGPNYTYIDDVSNILQGEGTFYYYIEALEGSGNTYGFQDTSISNIAQAMQDPFFYIPNAFTPLGLNPVFIPVNTFISKTDYTFSIFDRWGEKIFESNDPAVGWDGTYQSVKAKPGVYVYWIEYKNSKGESVNKKGTVTLIR